MKDGNATLGGDHPGGVLIIASTGRPGPVHVDLPKDILVKEWTSSGPTHVQMRSYNLNYDGHPGQIKRAAQLLARAKSPCSTSAAV